ncbi:MAG: 4-oxalomesaconate tautomerase [Rhodospirillales bacterium]|jgi:2-methylaconitate cis-trans-isomerase PrpF|nr:4-oxalomesaconate tautomerase [Rhodospirillales bacterium]
MPLTAIPYLFMRGGTSRGPYFLRSDLPEKRDDLAAVLLAAIGAGHPGNIDGLGGGSAVTCKVAMLSKSDHPGADVDYLFAQVVSSKNEVDFSPTCGNILAGVGPAAIEMGLVEPRDGVTTVRIRAVNTGSLIEADIQTPGGGVEYEGTARIDGVPGSAAPVRLNFSEVVGSKTGRLFPTGERIETIGGVRVTCVDAAMPMVVANAADFGLSGGEGKAELDANRAFYERMEPIRIEAGRRMGLGDVSRNVVPKFALLAPPNRGGTVASRYFMPWDCHPSYAVTGGIALSACILAPGTVAETALTARPSGPAAAIVIEHLSGALEIVADFAIVGGELDLRRIGTLRTARKIASGRVFVPSAVWSGAAASCDAA